MAEHVFYVAQGYIVRAHGPLEYDLWLADWRDRQQVNNWLDGKSRLPTDLITNARRDWTLDAPGPNGEVHFFVEHGPYTFTELSDDFLTQSLGGRVAIHESLWNKVPAAKRPLPKNPSEDYRVRLVVTDDGGVRRCFVGFHAQILKKEPASTDPATNIARPARTRVMFESWQGRALGVWWIPDAGWVDTKLLPRGTHSTLGLASSVADEGALFVEVSAMGEFNLALPIIKVPWGAQEP